MAAGAAPPLQLLRALTGWQVVNETAMRSVGAFDAKTHLAALLDAVSAGSRSRSPAMAVPLLGSCPLPPNLQPA